MNDRIEPQKIETAEFDDGFREALDRQETAPFRPWQLFYRRPLSVRRRLAP